MLNIGRLGTDLDVIVEYYLPEHDTDSEQANTQQSKAERYYLGGKDAPRHSGRWIGSLQDELRLDGLVDVEAFRRLLEGCHPGTDQPLTHGAAQARKKRMAARRRPQRLVESIR